MRELATSGGPAADLARAFEASANPYVLLTPDLHIAGMNEAYLEVTLSRREDIIGRHIFAAFDSGPGEDAPENVRQVRASMEKALRTGQRDHLAMVRFALAETMADGRTVYRERYWSATHTPIRDADGEIVYLLQHTSDITELELLRRARAGSKADCLVSALDAILGGAVLRRAEWVQQDNRRLEIERNRLAEMLMQAPGFVAILSGPDHTFEMTNEAHQRLIGRRDLIGRSVREALPDFDRQGFCDLLDSVLATGEPYEGRAQRVRLQPTPDGPTEEAYLDFILQPVSDSERRPIGIFVQGHDVTETVRAAERQKLMIDELNHRVKNTLATVQSIAMQTARSHRDPASFAEAFQSRLLSLSHTHDLLTRSHWEGAQLHAILEHETRAHGPMRLIANGPAVALGPAQALSLGMVFHELATNAAKYGALSSGDGRVFVDWSMANQSDRRLVLTWREIGGPPPAPPERQGFGTRLIERNIHHDLAGRAELNYATEGFIAELSFPLDRGQAT